MPKRRGNLNITIRKRRPTGPRQRKGFIRRRSTAFLLMLFMTLAGCKVQKLRQRPHLRSTQPVSLRRNPRGALLWSRALFLIRLLPQTTGQKNRRTNPLLCRPQQRTHRFLKWRPRVREQRPNSLLFQLRINRSQPEQAVSQRKRLPLRFRNLLLL